MRKLSELSLNIPEATYHQLPILSYSVLARYEREGGFKSLPRYWNEMFESGPRTEALIFGSAVDTLCTHPDPWTAYSTEFHVADLPDVPDKAKQVIDVMVDRDIKWMDTENILAILDEMDYYKNWKPATRIAKLCECDAKEYYDTAVSIRRTGKTLISREMDERIKLCYGDLYNNVITGNLMFTNPLPKEYGDERFFQLQFKAELDGVEYKIMCDMITVDHDKKSIHIYDLKTSGKPSYSFKESYLQWGYHIQSHLYRMVLAEVLKGTEYADYTIDGFSFIVASKVNDTPLVYHDLSKVFQRRPWLRDPRIIGKEISDSYSLQCDEDHPVAVLTRKPLPSDLTDTGFNEISFNED